VTGIDRQLRDLLEAAAGEPPHQVSAEAVRRRVSRRRARECLAGAAAVAVIIPVSTASNTAGQPIRLALGYPRGSRSPGRDRRGGEVMARCNAGPRAHAPEVAAEPGSITWP
jgi:hypothetical protein